MLVMFYTCDKRVLMTLSNVNNCFSIGDTSDLQLYAHIDVPIHTLTDIRQNFLINSNRDELLTTHQIAESTDGSKMWLQTSTKKFSEITIAFKILFGHLRKITATKNSVEIVCKRS